jgi:hypothetical protein
MKKPINQSGVNAEQKAAALKIKLPADWKPTAKVSITEVPPDADQIVQQLIKDPARYARLLVKYSARQIEAAPLIQKGKKRAESAKRSFEEFNKNRPLNNKKPALAIAADLMTKYPHLRLPRRTSELAEEVRARLVKLGGKQPEVRTLRRWLAEAIPKK